MQLPRIIDTKNEQKESTLEQRDTPKSSRRRFKTLSEAVKLQWKKKEIDSLCEQLDRYRSAIGAHIAVETRANSIKSIALLRDLSTQSDVQYASSIIAIDRLQEGIGALTTQISHSSAASHIQQRDLLDIINTFIDQLRSGQLFASLPPGLLEKYPALETTPMKRRMEIEETLLRALKFRMMSTRESDVEVAHAKTFSWIYESPKDQDEPWDNIAEWLRKGSGLYWIRGKAGSGKSTLLKYMTSRPRTIELLEEWAEGHTLIVPSYFFWKAGTELQKNQAGLLRAILSTILSHRRDLISVAFPGLYDNLMMR